MKARLRALRESVRTGFWALPTACVVGAVVLALVLVQVDRVLQRGLAYTFGAGPDGAREVLSAITTAMITFTGLVFSITIVVLQLTSSQFSPRVLRTFLRDRVAQLALGVFVATFVYAVMVLRTVDGGDDSLFVPALSTTVALGLLLVSVGVFVAYIHHISTAIQVTSIIRSIGDETRDAIDRRFPAGTDDPPDAAGVRPPDDLPSLQLPARESGVVVSVDEQRLVRLAREAGVVLRGRVAIGDYVPQGAPLLEVLGDPADLDTAAVEQAWTQGRNRTMHEDVAFGLRQLVDIAERALSPSTNDPTTATQVLDELHDLLRRLATRRLRTGVHVDEEGAVRLVLPPEDLRVLVPLALDEIEQYGAEATQVQQRLPAMLEDLVAAARPEHRTVLEDRLRRVSR